ncbi:hypothetical protein F5148DRAFT_1219202 [Russula earlei]|uniref:Uncharacterized protein n=1 Tax=Russula earlei TaxID=71964 RepID=A0ACC0U2H4_9AGAM|nr:hypothetical protein F5148DRAFT_1219202 [Russula earlei]
MSHFVPYTEWLFRLSEEHTGKSHSMANLNQARSENPALRLFSVFRAARTGPEREPLGVAHLHTTRAVQASKVFARGAKPLGVENVHEWLGAWRASVFFPPEGKKARLEASVI